MLIKRFITKEDFLKIQMNDGLGTKIGEEWCRSLTGKASSEEQLKMCDEIGEKIVFFLVMIKDFYSMECIMQLVSAELIEKYPEIDKKIKGFVVNNFGN